MRSNNSKNALTLVYEVFSVRSEVKKVSEPYLHFAKNVLPGVLNRTLADKNFIASLAKRSLTLAAESCPTWTVCQILVDNVNSKALALAEFSLQTISVLVKKAEPSFFTES